MVISRRSVVVLGASVGVAALGVVMFAGKDRAVDSSWAGSGSAVAEANAKDRGLRGIRRADVDSARRSGEVVPPQVGEDGAPRRFFPVARERPTRDEEPVEVREVPVVPPEPPSAEAIAESEAILAAQPAVQEAVDGAWKDRREGVRRSCWSGTTPASASFPVEVTYSAEGQMLALSISDDAAAPGIGDCVRGQSGLVPPTIEAPGVSVTVRTSFGLP